MNWLAHMLLARHSDAAMLGALLGDFAFGSSGLERYGDVERAEILLHRRIDRYTDTHPAVAEARMAFAPERRRFAGIALDMYFDHLLARDWDRWSLVDGGPAVTLDAFNQRAYAILHARFAELPPRLQAMVPGMAANDWLGGYRHRTSVDRAVARIATRLSRNGERLVACLGDLAASEARIAGTFEAFFPQLVAFTGRSRAEMHGTQLSLRPGTPPP